MKLKPEHLTPYLPYSLKVVMEGKKCNVAWMSTKNIAIIKPDGIGEYKKISWKYAEINIKPILKPLSELTKNDLKEELYQYYQTLGIDVKLVNYDSGNDNPFDMTLTVTYKMMGEVYTDCLINRGSTSETPYHIIVWLCENHFDIFGLIKDGLAIDINESKKASAENKA